MAKTNNTIPVRIQQVWPWIVAIDAWELCDGGPLAELVLSEPIPSEVKPAISEILSGTRKQNKRASAKLKIPVRERMEIAVAVGALLDLIDTVKYGTDVSGRKSVEVISERKQIEPVELIREIEKASRELVETIASDLGVSTETIENLMRDFRKKIDKWPVV